MKEQKKIQIIVIDGMGGGIGSQIIQLLKKNVGSLVELLALGTNALATSRMMNSGAKQGATGENAFRVNLPRADLIVGPLGIMMPNAMLGEITPAMAEWIGMAPGKKFLLPLSQSHFQLVGLENVPLAESLEKLVTTIEREVMELMKEQ